jgi:hypothetical protein
MVKIAGTRTAMRLVRSPETAILIAMDAVDR